MADSGGNRDGFTIIEVILALLLLSFTVLGFQAATGEIIHYAVQSDRETVATQLVEDRLDLIRLDPAYAELESRYGETRTSLPEYAGLIRSTTITRTYADQPTGVLDYRTITVTVDGPGLRAPVSRTVIVAAP